MVTAAKIAKWQNTLARYQTRLQTYQASGKAMKASKVLLKIQKLQKKMAKAQGVAAGAVAGAGFVGLGAGVAFAGAGGVSLTGGARRTYSVQLDRGAIRYQAQSGRVVTLGYTPHKAKKMYRTKRRRKRLSSRDKAILAAIVQNPQAAAALTMMM